MLLITIFQVPVSILPIKKLPFKVNGEGCALVQVCAFVLIDVSWQTKTAAQKSVVIFFARLVKVQST